LVKTGITGGKGQELVVRPDKRCVRGRGLCPCKQPEVRRGDGTGGRQSRLVKPKLRARPPVGPFVGRVDAKVGKRQASTAGGEVGYMVKT